MGQYLGRMGESFFNSLCASVGITCNQAQEDMAGWDFILDFPVEKMESDKSDMLPSPIECKVQIKSTNKNRKSSSITLSNLLRFAKSPLPAFFIFIEYNSQSTPESIYLVHFDSTLITQTLKRVREIEQSSKQKKLNKCSIKINYDNSHRLVSLSGIALKESIESYVPKGMDSYTEDKISFFRKVGFDTGSASMTFTTSGEENLVAMIEATLGIQKDVVVNNIIIKETRFGIASKEPLSQSSSALLRISPTNNYIDIQMSFFKNRYEPPLVFPAKLYISPLYRLIPKEYSKARIQGEFFEIILSTSGGIGSYSFELDSKVMSVKELKNAVKLVNWACFLDGSLHSEIKALDGSEKEIQLQWSNKNNSINNNVKAEWENQHTLLLMAYDVVCRFDLQDRLLTNIREIGQNFEAISNIYDFYHSDSVETMFTFEPINDYNNNLLEKEHFLVYAIPVKIGDSLMVVIASFLGRM